MELFPNDEVALRHLLQLSRSSGSGWDPFFDHLVHLGMATLQGGLYSITPHGKAQLVSTDTKIGEARKQAGQARVMISTGDNWRDDALRVVHDVAVKEDYLTMADVRRHGIVVGLSEPSHPNAWGALFRSAAKEGWIEPTDEFKKSSIVSAHARMVRVWRSKI